MTCKNITFGMINVIESATLTSTPESVTELDNLKNPHREMRAKWDDLSGDIVTIGTYTEDQFADYFALIGSNMRADAVIKLELFASNDATGTDLLQMGDIAVGKLIPLGVWRAGVDPYNERTEMRGDEPLTLWFDSRITFQSFKLTIEHGYIVETPVYNDVPTQDEFGVVSLEAEDGDIINVGDNQWTLTTDGTASGGESLYITSGFYNTANTGPRFIFVFDATATGTHKVWLRVKMPTTGGNDSIHVDLDGAVTTKQNLTVSDAWHWEEVASVQLVDETTHTLIISARESKIYVDKVVILPNADPAPTGTGPAASTYGVEGSTDNVQVRLLQMGTVWRPEVNYAYGAVSRSLTPAEIGYNSSGNPVVVREPKSVKQMTVQLEHMTDNDRFMLERLETERAGRSFFFSSCPECAGWASDAGTFMGRFTSSYEYSHVFINHHKTTKTIEEV